MPESPEQRRLARKRRRHARARDELVRAAERILAESGVAGFSVKAVAAAADVSKPAFYYYFASREHLVAELADRVLSREAAALVEAAYRAASPAAAAAEIIRTKVQFYRDDLAAFQMAYLWPQVIGTPDDFDAEVVQPRRRQVLDVLTARLQEDPGSTPPEQAAQVALATADGLLSSTLQAVDRASLADAAASIFERALKSGAVGPRD